jgi:hypothetical protein
LQGKEVGGYGLRLAIMDEKRKRAGESLTRMADAVEEASEVPGQSYTKVISSY